MTYTRKNKGVCSLSTEVTLTDDGVIESVTVVGGCNGNLKGISALLTGLRAEDAIRRLKGLTCGSKHTARPVFFSALHGKAGKTAVRPGTGHGLTLKSAGAQECPDAQKKHGPGSPCFFRSVCGHTSPVKERSDG